MNNEIAVSTWALHPLLRRVSKGRPGEPYARMIADNDEPATLDLMDVPKMLQANGYAKMELCHFHLPQINNDAAIEMLRAELATNGVQLWSLLIDDGDISHAENGRRDMDWIAGWIEIAGKLGAVNARVIAGKQSPTVENLDCSIALLRELVHVGKEHNVHINTENWFALLPTPKEVHYLQKELNGEIGLCVDFGNWGGANKYENLSAIAPFGTACHAKCNFVDGQPDIADYENCLHRMRTADYANPLTLVYGEPDSVWESLDTQRRLIRGVE